MQSNKKTDCIMAKKIKKAINEIERIGADYIDERIKKYDLCSEIEKIILSVNLLKAKDSPFTETEKPIGSRELMHFIVTFLFFGRSILNTKNKSNVLKIFKEAFDIAEKETTEYWKLSDANYLMWREIDKEMEAERRGKAP